MAVDSVCDVDMTEDGGVKFSIVMVVKPEVVLGQYKGLNVAKKAVKVTAKQVDERIAQEQEKQARLIDVDTEAVNGNTVTIDLWAAWTESHLKAAAQTIMISSLEAARSSPALKNNLSA